MLRDSMRALCRSLPGAFIGLLFLLPALRAGGLRADGPPSGLPPVILVPGTPGVELLDRKTGALIFPRAKLMFTRYGSDVLALPLEHPEETEVVAGPLIRRVKVALGLTLKIDAYGPLLSRLRAQGYREGNWDRPGEGPEYYVLLYDWRQSVESSARTLYQKMAALRARQPAGTPPFVMVGHSIGGMLIRYALMYGDAPLGASGPLPSVTWAGGALMSHAYLVAAPNEGTFAALCSLHKGNFYRLGWGAFSPETLFTLPGIFDMIPAHPDPLVDPHGKPLAWDLNDPDHWERLHWSVFDPAHRRKLSLDEARQHLRHELSRKARLLEALAAIGPTSNSVVMHLVGSDCNPVLRSGVVSGREGHYKVRFKPPSGESRERLRGLLFEPGDGTISRRSLTAADLPHDPRTTVDFASVSLPCSSHHKLMGSPLFLDALLPELERIAHRSGGASVSALTEKASKQ